MATTDAASTSSGQAGVGAGWTVADSAALYGVDQWGDPYFSVNEQGHVQVRPQGSQGPVLDLVELVKGLQGRNLSLPLLIRFDNILEDRLKHLHQAFEQAIHTYNYPGHYQGVFPVKCNQQRLWHCIIKSLGLRQCDCIQLILWQPNLIGKLLLQRLVVILKLL